MHDPRRARTYRLQPATIAAFDALAAQTEIGKDSLADALLTHALDQVHAGRWTIHRRATVWELAAIEEHGEPDAKTMQT